MKILQNVIVVLLLAAVTGACTGGKGKNGAKIREIVTTENTEADFGVMKEKDGPVKAILVVRNETPDTLFPAMAYTRCGCLTASVDRTPVPPGGDVRVGTEYDPSYKKGIVMEEVGVTFQDGRPMLSLIIKGEVIPMKHPVGEDHPYDFGEGLHLSHEVLHYGKMRPGQTGDIFIRVASERKRRTTVSFLPDEALKDHLAFRDGLVLEKEGRDTLHFRFTMPEGIPAGDTVWFSIYPALDGKTLDKPLKLKTISKD